MTTRRGFITVLAASGLPPPSPVFGQQAAARIARVGWLSSVAMPDPGLDLLRQGMRELGYVEGSSYVIVARYAAGDAARVPALVDELSNERLDVLVARGPTALYTMSIRSRVPVVFAFSGDPVAAGFADSLAKPGRNMTGLTFMAMELSAKRVEVLKELVPLLSNPEHPGELGEYRVTDEAARRLGATITRYLVRSPQELTAAYATITANRPDAMIVFPDALTFARREEIAEFAARAKIPCIYGWTEYSESGGLISYGPTLGENFKGLSVFVDKLLKGASASSIPIEQVKKINLTLNLRTARALALNVPPSMLARADRLIE
jgi:ABC-type uncharacterized transport system substrate-binding protein